MFVYAADGTLTRRIDTSERPLQLLIGSTDMRTLYILAHRAFYAVDV